MSYIRSIVTLAKRDPIRTFAVIRSGIALVLAFWPGLVTEGQTAAILAFGAVWFMVDEGVRQSTTPTAAPRLDEGTQVTVITPEGEPNRMETL